MADDLLSGSLLTYSPWLTGASGGLGSGFDPSEAQAAREAATARLMQMMRARNAPKVTEPTGPMPAAAPVPFMSPQGGPEAAPAMPEASPPAADVPIPRPRPAEADAAALPPSATPTIGQAPTNLTPPQGQPPAPTTPASAMPAAPISPTYGAPPAAEANPVGDFLGKAWKGVGDNRLTLLALASGMAGAPSLAHGLSRGFAAAVPAMAAEQKSKTQTTGIRATYQALVERGVPPGEALAAVYNPEVLKAVVAKHFEVKPPSLVTEENPDGTKRHLWADPYKQTLTPASGAPSVAPANPYWGGKVTDEQSKNSSYATRMLAAEQILRDPKVVEAGASLTQRSLSNFPIVGKILGNYAVSEPYQKFDQAQRNFVNAVLRRESGAVISDSEFDNAKKQYFPQPGDSQANIEQKLKNREDAIRGIAGGAGPNYRPPDLSPTAPPQVPVAAATQPAAAQPAPPPAAIPQVGTVSKGYRFLGGDPSNPDSWQRVQ